MSSSQNENVSFLGFFTNRFLVYFFFPSHAAFKTLTMLLVHGSPMSASPYKKHMKSLFLHKQTYMLNLLVFLTLRSIGLSCFFRKFGTFLFWSGLKLYESKGQAG